MSFGPLRWERWPDGPRCYLRTPLGKLRVHHGLAGVLMMVVGALLTWHDRLDRPWLNDH